MFHVVYASATSHLLSKAELHALLEETRHDASQFGIKVDIPLLVAHFLGKFSDSLQSVLAISDDALRRLWRLMAYDSPGNVRELENAIECAVALSSDSVLTVDDLAAIPNGAQAGSLPTSMNSSLLRKSSVAQSCTVCGKPRR